MSKQVEVAIIGAGLAGLACAIELQKNNINFQIFEKGIAMILRYCYFLNLVEL